MRLKMQLIKMVAPGDKIFPFFHSFQQEPEGMTRNSKNGVNIFS